MSEFLKFMRGLLPGLTTDKEVIGTIWALVFALAFGAIFKFIVPAIERRWPRFAPQPNRPSKLRLAIMLASLGLFFYVITR